MRVDELVARLQGVKKTGAGYMALCPAHADKNPSLSVGEGDDGRVLVRCFAGCSTEAVCASLGLTLKDLMPEQAGMAPAAAMPRKAGTQKRGWKDLGAAAADLTPAGYRLAAVYEYPKSGKPFAAAIRYENADGKTFRQFNHSDGLWRAGGPDEAWPLFGEAGLKPGTIIVGEGEKVALAGRGIGLNATCSAGGAGAAAKTDWSACSGREVVVFPDADEPGAKYAANVARLAYKAGATTVKVVELPGLGPSGDMADWIEGRDASDSETLCQEIEALVKAAPVLESRTDARAVTSPANGQKGGRPEAPSHAETADRFAREQLTKNGKLIVRHWRGGWYLYRDNQGWRDVPEAEIQALVVTYLRGDANLRKHTTTSYAASVVMNLRAHDLCGLPCTVEMPCFLDKGESGKNWVAFKNGVIVNIWEYAQALAENREPRDYMRTVTADFFALDFVSYDWSPGATCELFMSYLRRVQPEQEGQAAVQRMMGLLLADTTRFEVFYQLLGYGCNGKTVLLDIIKALVGHHAVSYVTLDGILERFQSWPLATSKVNICGELPTDVGRGQFHAIEGAFKDCVSGGDIEVERKNKDKYTAKCRARFVMATNSLPTFFDRSDGIWRRLRIIPFLVQIADAEKDVTLAEKICRSDLPGIMQWALHGLACIIRAGNVAECAPGQALKDRHRMDCDHERQFLQESIVKGNSGDRIKADELYSQYSTWMQNNGYRACGASRFYSRVEEVYPGVVRKRTRVNGVPTTGFEGIKMETLMGTKAEV